MTMLENENIRLIPLDSGHEQVFVRVANIPKINQRINKPLLYTASHFAEQLSNIQKTKSNFVWMIEYNKALVGVANNAATRHPKVFQGGYWIDPAYWGQGIASASLTLVKNFILQECEAERIQAVVEPDNTASMRVLEKCGYIQEGLLRKFYPSVSRGLIDVYMYAVTK